MKTFPAGGRIWSIDINVDSIEQVRELIDVNLYDVFDGKLFEELGRNPRKLVDILWCLCKEQAEKERVTDRQFGQAFRGDAIDLATKALLEDLASFFPAQQSAILNQLLGKSEAVRNLALQRATEAVDKITPEKILASLLEERSGSSGNAPESSASIPASSGSDA